MKIDWDDVLTGEIMLDLAIIRFICDPRELPCDKPTSGLDYWRKNGTDGIASYKIKYGIGPFGGTSKQGDGGVFVALTRDEVMERYDEEST